ncbi:MAG: Ribosomal protein [Candidatus Saccharibacteria bacterium]|nr:Ribosomal protein [Candidatus Saccharibacteria bacterium]
MATAKKTTKKSEEPAVVTAIADAQDTSVIASDTIVETPVEEEKAPKPIAKAGKRSAKALEESAEKTAKEERKESGEDEAEKPRQHSNPTRSRLERRGKLFREKAALVEVGKKYNLEEAVELARTTSHVKFDATVEMHINLGVDPRHADQNIRDNLVLPAGTGKNVRIVVLTDDPAAATAAGAELAGNEEVLARLEKGDMNFDILIATPALMPKLGKYARVLGPRGLMPNPKSGTVTNDVNRAVAEAKAGRVEYRVDTTGIVHLGVGKVSFTGPDLLLNVQAVLTSVKANKPASVKGNYFKAAYITTSMGPSIAVDLTSIN